MAYDWAKLWIEMLDDRKTASLPDSSWRRFVECILLAMETNEGGLLPSVQDMAWRLRVTPETMNDDLTRLALGGLVELVDDGQWKVTNFAKRQAAIPMADRVASFREREKKKRRQPDSNVTVTSQKRDGNEGVTKSYTEEIRIDKKRGEENANPRTLAAENNSPSLSVYYQPIDRTPAGFRSQYGYQPPAEPPAPVEKRPDPAIGEMANVLSEVTGVSAKLLWSDPKGNGVGDLAADLLKFGYTADLVRRAYSRDETTGWNWYTRNWKGRDKGDMPTLRDIRETISAPARESEGKKPAKKLSQIDIALGLGGVS